MVVNSHLSIHNRFYGFTSWSRTSSTSSIVPAFLRSTSCGMTSAHGHGAIVYCLNSGMLCEGNTRNRWCDGQVYPDVRQGTMAPWARRLGWEKRRTKEETREKEDKKEVGRGGREKSGENGRRENGEETRGEDRRDGERKGLSPELEWKDDERRWR
ncbi:hypothetical protein TNCV_1878271 [Trichonephila clavipes]|nr:hypothetical protein TNCV_1878271 [Trichonephila clavipes]